MKLLSTLHFMCDSPKTAEWLVEQHQAAMDRVNEGALPRVTVGDCCGVKEVELKPYWLKRGVERAVPEMGPAQLAMRHEVTLVRGNMFHLLIEISAKEKSDG